MAEDGLFLLSKPSSWVQTGYKWLWPGWVVLYLLLFNFPRWKTIIGVSPYRLSKYQTNLYKGQFVRLHAKAIEKLHCCSCMGTSYAKLHLFWLLWILCHDRSPILTNYAFQQNIKIHLTLKTEQDQQKTPFLLFFASTLFTANVLLLDHHTTQVLTDVFFLAFPVLAQPFQYKWTRSFTLNASCPPESYPYVRKYCLYCPLQDRTVHWHVCE